MLTDHHDTTPDARTDDGAGREAGVLYIVMPAYNEAGRIGKVLAALPSAIHGTHCAYPTRVVVVDDCSSDETGDIAVRAGAIVLRHTQNRGAGAATRTGLAHVLGRGDCVFVATIDADGQHSVDDLTRMIVFAEDKHAPVVVGNRLHGGNASTMPWHRVLGNRVLDAVGSLLFGLNHVDTQCGLRVFSSEALPVIARFRIDRYGFCTEMLWRAQRAHMRIDSIPIAVTYSRDTLIKGQRPWGIFRLVFDLVRVRISAARRAAAEPGPAATPEFVPLIGHRASAGNDRREVGQLEETAQ